MARQLGNFMVYREIFYDKVVEEAEESYCCPTNFVSNFFVVKLRLLAEFIVV